jgi:hypothetical protein
MYKIESPQSQSQSLKDYFTPSTADFLTIVSGSLEGCVEKDGTFGITKDATYVKSYRKNSAKRQIIRHKKYANQCNWNKKFLTLFSLKFNIIFMPLTKFLFLTYIQDPDRSAFILKAGSGSAFTYKTGYGSAYSQCGSETLDCPLSRQFITSFLTNTGC